MQSTRRDGPVETLEYRDDVHHENGVYTSLRRRLQEPNIPTAIFAEDEISALGAERAIAEAGLRVPQDVSVMTCLNARFMRLVAPHLTVLNVRLNEAATEAWPLACENAARGTHRAAPDFSASDFGRAWQHRSAPVLISLLNITPERRVPCVTLIYIRQRHALLGRLLHQIPQNITRLVRVSGGHVIIPGTVIDRIGRSAAAPGDKSDPGLVLVIREN